MKIAITGSNGFIGKCLVEQLRQKHEIVHLDIENGIDLTDWNIISKIEEFDCMYHLAAKSYVPDSFKYPQLYYHTNIISTLNALELCKRNKARFIFMSSYVYGAPNYLPIDEKHPICAFNPYSESKLISESLFYAYHRDFNLQGTIVRPFNIIGLGQNEDFLIPKIVLQAKKGSISLMDSEPKRDYIHVRDVVSALERCLDISSEEIEVINLGSGISYSVREVVSLILKKINKKIPVEYTMERRQNEVMDVVADIRKAKKILGWSPKISLEEGIDSFFKN